MKISCTFLLTLLSSISLIQAQTVSNPPPLGSVIMIDDDGWWLDTSSQEYLDYQAGKLDTLPYKAPAGLGHAQINTLNTHTQNMRSFASLALTHSRQANESKSNYQLWVAGTGHYFTQENQKTTPGYHYRALGSALGFNMKFNQWNAGLAFSESDGQQSTKGTAIGTLDQIQLMGLLYINRDISLDKSNSLNITLQGGYGNSTNQGNLHFYELDQSPDFRGFWRDQSWMLNLTTEWNHVLTENLNLLTYLGFHYNSAEQNDHGIANDLYSYRFNDGSQYLFQSSLGTGIVYKDTLAQLPYRIALSLGIVQDIARETAKVTMQGKTHSWTTQGSKPGRTAFTHHSGITLALSDTWQVGLNYAIEYAEERLDQSGSLSLNFSF